MGCASSKGDINDQHPNIFQVMNVDEEFHPISPGQIEITSTELVFHQRGKLTTKWSLRNLRKYGFDAEIFSFECGRRCATGPGIFAFKCRKAEQLFNLLQHNIQVRNMNEAINMQQLSELTITAVPASMQQRQQRTSAAPAPEAPAAYLNPSTQRPTLSRPGSITSNGPASPSPPLEDNNNKRSEHSYLNTDAIHMQVECNPPQYINVAATATTAIPNGDLHQDEAQARLYMNVDVETIAKDAFVSAGEQQVSDKNDLTRLKLTLPPVEEDTLHCYANINTSLMQSDALHLQAHNFNDTESTVSNHCSNFVIGPTTPTITEVNYVELDLVPSGKTAAGAGANTSLAAQPPPDSPDKTKSYVTIDFKKTNALSQSIHPRIDLEEGCRKTRHNSTIGDLRQSNSISD